MILLLGVGAGVRLWKPSTSASMTTVVSDDRTLTLEIPVGSLPSGTRARDLRVVKADPETLPARLEPDMVLAAYTMEPSGLRLATPATFRVTLPVPEQAVVHGLHVAESGAEELEGLAVEREAGTGETIVTGTLQHFSAVIFYHRVFEVQIDDPKDRDVGEQFLVKVKTTLLKTSYSLRLDDGSLVTTTVGTPWTLTGRMETRGGITLLEPFVVNGLPEHATVQGREYDTAATFRCARPGTVFIAYSVKAVAPEKAEYGESGLSRLLFRESRESFATGTVHTKPFLCRGKDGFRPPSPSVPPQPTPVPTPPPGTRTVEVLRIDGKDLPAFQFHPQAPDICGARHYHARNKKNVLSLDLTWKY